MPLSSAGNTLSNYGLAESVETQEDELTSRRGFIVRRASDPIIGAARSRRIRIAIGLLLGFALIFVVVDSFTKRYVEKASLNFLEWVQQNPKLGVLAVVVIYTLATILFVPGAVITIGTGFAFGKAFDSPAQGIFLASTAVFFGASCGSLCAFLLGRYLFRECVVSLASNYPVFQAIDRALQGNGLKIMILLRLSPLIPYNALDYMSGVTSIPLWAYALALIAMLPGVVMFTFIGATASSLSDGATATSESKTARILSLVFGVIFAIAGVAVASYYSKLELNKILQDGSSSSRVCSSSPLNEELEENELTKLENDQLDVPSLSSGHDVV